MTKLPLTASIAAIVLAGSAQAQSSPWFGRWALRLKDPAEKPETLIYSDAGNGRMRMESIEQGSVIVTRFDGAPAPDIGTGAGTGNALAITAVTPTSYTWTFFAAGKPFVQGRNSLAFDRMTFTEVSWLVSKPGKLVTLIYDRR